MDMKKRRKGALVARPCDLCGSLVDERDLVMSEVQGLRGNLVCSAHGWEREARVRPSFQDRGGVGQVPDLSIDPIWPGSNGGWIGVVVSLLPAEDDMAIVAYKASDLNRTGGSAIADDPDLFAGVTTAGTYLIRVCGNVTSIGQGFKGAFAFSGTSTDAYGSAAAYNGSVFDWAALTTLTSLGGSTNVATSYSVEFEMYVVATSAGTFNFQWRPGAFDDSTLKMGSYMSLTQLA